jgi:uncharacterized protein (TIGR03083 family)
MDDEAVWQVVHHERRALGALLRELTPARWEHPSLCQGWTVRDVAAHVIAWPDTTVAQALVATWRARLRYNRMIRDEARRRAARQTSQILADFDRLAGSRHRPPFVTCHEALVDVVVHTQDIALPLGLRHDMPREASAHCATRVWRIGFPFWARRRLSGLRLEATDVDWSVGEGAPVEGPVGSLLLLLTGRRAALERLTGEGAARLAARTGASAGG